MKKLKYELLIIVAVFSSFTGMAQENSTDDRNIVRVLTFNILHGATTKGDFNLDVIANVINETNPDLVALQEVDFKTNRAKKLDLTTELALRTGMTSFFARAMEYDNGEYGEGVLSKWTFLQTRNIHLPHQSSSEPRAAAEATIIIPSGDTIQFIGTHLDHLKENRDRIMQAREINKVFIDNEYPTILAGDLNDVPESKTIEILESEWGTSYDKSEPTFPSNFPRVKIDYVLFYPKTGWKVLETKVICDEIASDHCAYLVILELLPNK